MPNNKVVEPKEQKAEVIDDTRCGTCQRKIVEGNEKAKKVEGVTWCGGCDKSVSYISYPLKNDSEDSIISNQKDKEILRVQTVPVRPPWTNFSGLIQAPKDSEEGKKLLEMDPNAEDGYMLFKEKKKGEAKFTYYESKTNPKVKQLPDHVRGLWTHKVVA
jgi:hypothetical protein